MVDVHDFLAEMSMFLQTKGRIYPAPSGRVARRWLLEAIPSGTRNTVLISNFNCSLGRMLSWRQDSMWTRLICRIRLDDLSGTQSVRSLAQAMRQLLYLICLEYRLISAAFCLHVKKWNSCDRRLCSYLRRQNQRPICRHIVAYCFLQLQLRQAIVSGLGRRFFAKRLK